MPVLKPWNSRTIHSSWPLCFSRKWVREMANRCTRSSVGSWRARQVVYERQDQTDSTSCAGNRNLGSLCRPCHGLFSKKQARFRVVITMGDLVYKPAFRYTTRAIADQSDS